MKFFSQFRYERLTKKLNFLNFLLEKEKKLREEIEEKQEKINKVRLSNIDDYVNNCLWEKWVELNGEFHKKFNIISKLEDKISKTKRKINNLS